LINPPHGRKTTDSLMTEGKEASPIIYAALGDSTGVGVGARQGGYVIRLFNRMEQARPGSKLTNVCVSGATTEDVLRRQLEQALAARPNLITLGIGINDVGRRMNVETFARNYETIIKRLKTANAPIVVTNIPDVSLAPVVPLNERAEAARRIMLFNERIAEIASRYDLLVVDAFKATRETIPTRPDFFSDDGFHPSDAGYEYWAEAMWPTVKKAMGE
ncbi:MAG TPA: SGNH/GDSL hydrolase family protein, partial [Pyrinomonadaceae bacterium]|nr:SGNH/GDSL hydrolase family protein [Pyrinomonadaceae bacterium]